MKTPHTLFTLLLVTLLSTFGLTVRANDTLIIEQVYFCPTQSIVYRGLTIDKEGVYYDTLYSQTTGKPDSVYQVVANHAPSYYYRDTMTLYAGKTVSWRGKVYDQTGTYHDYFTTVLGCDSVYELYVVKPIAHHFYDTVAVCKTDIPYQYQGRLFYEEGDYDIAYVTTAGTDSIFSLHLTLNPVHEKTIYHELCSGETFRFRGDEITEQGIYSDTLLSSQGCDSIVHFVVSFSNHVLEEWSSSICEGDTFLFFDQKLTQEEVYYHTTQNEYGCEKTIKLILTVSSPRETYIDKTLCPGESYWFNGVELTQRGHYVDTLLTRSGCDSVVHVILNVRNTIPRSTLTLRTCEDEPVLYKGTRYYAPTTFYDTVPAIDGCDSIVTVVVQAQANYLFAQRGSLSGAGTYEWRGKAYTAPGIYYDSLRTAFGCDSVYQLTLCSNSTGEEHLYGCQGDSLRYRDRVLTQSIVFYDTLLNRYGCDSIVQVSVHFSPTYHIVEDKHICQGEVYLWREQQCLFEGSYFDTLPSRSGCDSIFELRLTVGKPQLDSVHVDYCQSDLPFLWHGTSFYESGVYYDTLLTVNGCDSLCVLDLQVHSIFEQVEYHDICQGDYILVNGDTVTETGVFERVYVTQNGCDSIYRTVVNVRKTDTIYQEAWICSNQTYSWRGQELKMANIYYDAVAYTGTNHPACDSVVYILNLEVRPSQNEITEKVLCADSLPYIWRERLFWTDTLVADTMVNSIGCDSIFTLQLTIARCSEPDTAYLCPGSQVKVDGIWYDSIGEYRNQVGADTIHRFVVVDADSVVTRIDSTICSSSLPFTLGGIRVFKDQVRTDTVNILRERLTTSHGCDSVIELHLTVIPSPFVTRQVRVCHDDVYYFRGQELTKSGVYYDTLYSVQGCDSIIRLVLTHEQTSFVNQKARINVGSSYDWHGKSYSDKGIYYDTIRSAVIADCDSIIYCLDLTVNEGYHFYDTVSVCSNRLPYRWFGQSLTEAGNYTQRYTTIHGADSVYHLSMVVDSAYIVTQMLTTCTGRSYTYYDTLLTVSGCDSVVRYVVNRATPSPLTTMQVATCQGEPYYFRGKAYKAPCLIHDTLLNAQGCDSVIRYVVNAYPTVSIDRYDTIFEGQTYTFNNEIIRNEGTYVMRAKTSLGCDSVIRLHLYVYHPYFREDTVTLCYDSPDFPYVHKGREYRASTLFKDTFRTTLGYDSVVWTHLEVYPRIPETVIPVSLCNMDVVIVRGQIITEAGNYYDTLSSVLSGCDSILHYIVNRGTPSEVVSVPVSTCQGEPYYFRGKQYQAPCVFYDTLLNTVGCDSVVRYVLNGYPTVVSDRYDTIVEGQTYRFNGEDYHLGGTYVIRGKTVNGCDSIVRLHLHMLYPHFHEDTVTLCYDSPDFPYIHHGRAYRNSTVFKDTILTPLGYDSVIWTYLVVYPRIPETVIPISLCNDDKVQIRGQIISKPGNYYDTVASKVSGCDSVLHYIVRKGQTYYIQQRDSFCMNEGYVWRGHRHDTVLRYPGVYYDRLVSSAGCDSIYELTLDGKEVYFTDTTILVCPDEFPIKHNNLLFNEARMVSDTFKSVSCGCDSILRTRYVLTNKCSEIDHIYRCINEPLHLGEVDIQNAGYYRLEQWTRTGLDSVYRVRVDTAFPSFDTIYASICQGDTFHLGPINATTPGIHRLVNDNRFGCDSLTVLSLTVYNRSYANALRVNVPDYELPYIWRHQTYLTSGNYEDYTYDLSNGCVDSVYRLQLNVIETRYDTLSYQICRGDSILFRRQWYNRTTYMTDTLRDMQAGRSEITILDLQVFDSTRVSGISVTSDCADADEVLLQTTFTGVKPDTYSLRFLDDKAYQNGFSDQTNQPFSATIRIPVPAHSGTSYTRPDNYRVRITFYNGTCGYVAHEADFTLKYPSWIMEQKWDHMIALLNENNNGGYRFTGYRWQVKGKNITSTEPFFYSPSLMEGDTVIVSLSLDGTGYVESCPFIVRGYQTIYHEHPIVVYPTAAPAHNAAFRIEAQTAGEWTAVNSAGEICAQGTYNDTEDRFNLPPVSGCYLIILRGQDGVTTTKKVILY